jgi:hypothetical protein
MQTKLRNYAQAKKEAAIASGKAYATQKGKEIAYRSVNGIMATEQFKKLDDMGVKYINVGLDYASDRLDKVDSFNTKAHTATASFLDKTAKAMMNTGLTVAVLGIFGGVIGSFATTNFFWLILSALSLVAFGTVLGAGISYFKEGKEEVSPIAVAIAKDDVPVVAAVVASIEEKLPHLDLATPELKAA